MSVNKPSDDAALPKASLPQRPPQSQPRRRRWWLWAAAVPLLILAAPYMFRIGPVRRGVLGAALAGQDLSVEIDQAPLGWFAPLAVKGVEVGRGDGEAAVSVTGVLGDKPLWRYLWSPRSLGHFDVNSPEVRLTLADPDAGLIGLLKKKPGAKEEPVEAEEVPEEPEQLEPLELLGSLAIERGRLVVSGGTSGKEWSVGQLSLTAEMRKVAGFQGTVFSLTPGTPLDHVELSPGVCNDLLKFVAPHLANVARADGAFTLRVDECWIPLAELRRLRVRGQLVIHHASIGPGTLIRELAEKLGIEHLATAPTDTSIEFSVIGAEVLHEALEFQLGKLRVLTRGSVGFDQSLDLQIEVPMPAHLLKEGPLRAALADQSLILPVRGTLKKPEIDARALGQSGVQTLKATLRALLPKPEETAAAEPDAPGAGPAEATLDDEAVEERLLAEGLEAGEALLESLRKHRQEREAAGTPTLWEQWRERRRGGTDAPSANAPRAEAPSARALSEPEAPDVTAPADEAAEREAKPDEPQRPRLRDRLRRPGRRPLRDEAPSAPQ